MEIKTLSADADFARADVFISRNMAEYTRSAIKKLFENGNVKIGGVCIKPSRKIAIGEAVEITLPDMVECAAKRAPSMRITLLHLRQL